jgi:hypothetical protein
MKESRDLQVFGHLIFNEPGTANKIRGYRVRMVSSRFYSSQPLKRDHFFVLNWRFALEKPLALKAQRVAV